MLPKYAVSRSVGPQVFSLPGCTWQRPWPWSSSSSSFWSRPCTAELCWIAIQHMAPMETKTGASTNHRPISPQHLITNIFRPNFPFRNPAQQFVLQQIQVHIQVTIILGDEVDLRLRFLRNLHLLLHFIRGKLRIFQAEDQGRVLAGHHPYSAMSITLWLWLT